MKRSRRRLLGATAMGLTASMSWAALATELIATPRQSEGPFYPNDIPLGADNDLVWVQGASEPAAGEICNVVGKLTDTEANAIVDAKVEIWQCNAFGRYHHQRDTSYAPLDPNFQGYGSTMTDAAGNYRFRTIKPVHYPGRAPHIHFAVRAPDRRHLVTQLYVKGEAANEDDALLARLPRELREQLIRPFTPNPSTPGELLVRFNLVTL